MRKEYWGCQNYKKKLKINKEGVKRNQLIAHIITHVMIVKKHLANKTWGRSPLH